jgi:hypothetical protein
VGAAGKCLRRRPEGALETDQLAIAEGRLEHEVATASRAGFEINHGMFLLRTDVSIVLAGVSCSAVHGSGEGARKRRGVILSFRLARVGGASAGDGPAEAPGRRSGDR